MVKVENRDTLRFLTSRFMKMNKSRNAIAILAIALTSLMFTSLFMGTVSLILSKQATDIKQFMDSSHAIIQNLTQEEGERAEAAAKNEESVQRVGSGYFLGPGMNPQFVFSTEVRSADENLAESFNCLPTTGTLPQKKMDIAVSTLVLDALEIPHQLGQQVTITYENTPTTEELKTDTFRLCGFWEGDKGVISQMIWVSDGYARENRYPVTREELDNGILQGGMDCVVWYKSLWKLEEKTRNLSAHAGLPVEIKGFEVNPAYNLMEEDAFSFQSVAVMLLFILLAGYLIIYNIFSISVRIDIRAYGLLKNVGTTGKQLKNIVRMQAWRLSVVGIPAGLLLGYGAGRLMAPSLTANAEINAQAGKTGETVISANPLIFLAAFLFTLLTVYLSSIQACRMVERVSPVEALRLAECDETTRKVKRNTSVTWWGMAVQNMLRNWKKGLVVMLSIALSMVVVNCIVMLVQGYDFEMYQKTFLAADFQVDQMASSLSISNFNGVSPRTKELLEACPYSESMGYVYYSEEKHEMEPGLRNVWEENAQTFDSDYEREIWKQVEESNVLNVHYMGISQSVFEKLEWKENPCSWEEFQTGDYVIVDYNHKYSPEPSSYYSIGDSFQMEYQNGKSEMYQVLGEALMPYALDYPFADSIYLTVLVPESEYIASIGNDSAMYAALDAKEGMERQAKKYIEEKVLKENEMLNVFSVLDMQESFQRYVNKFYMIGGCLVAVLAFIGIMNFFNTMATSVLSRKKELALLEAVGMTKRQISKMLVAEGCIYLVGAEILAILIVCLGAEKILSHTVGMAFFFQMHLTIVPCIAVIPILVMIAWGVPKYQFRKLSQESVVERIRRE